MEYVVQTYSVPPLPLPFAHAGAALVTAGYVGVLYAAKGARLGRDINATGTPLQSNTSQERSRDDPAVIRARIAAVSASTSNALFAFLILLRWIVENNSVGNEAIPELWVITFRSAAARLGFTMNIFHQWSSHLVTPVLFAGPLYAQYLFKTLPGQAQWSYRRSLMPIYSTWIGRRNFIFVSSNSRIVISALLILHFQGPITEELVFRSCILAIYQLAGASKKFMIFATPLFFGLGVFDIRGCLAPATKTTAWEYNSSRTSCYRDV
jgi:prenyl protein peptidase